MISVQTLYQYCRLHISLRMSWRTSGKCSTINVSAWASFAKCIHIYHETMPPNFVSVGHPVSEKDTYSASKQGLSTSAPWPYYVLTGLYALMSHCAKHIHTIIMCALSLCSYYMRFPALPFSCPSCKSYNATFPCRSSPQQPYFASTPRRDMVPRAWLWLQRSDSGESQACGNSIRDESDLAPRDD